MSDRYFKGTPRNPLRHAGPCGERIPCPRHGLPFGPHYKPAERLRNGDVLTFDCGRRLRPWELAAFEVWAA